MINMEFHHIGIAVKDISKTAEIYVKGGFMRSEVTFDPIQNVNICWLTKEGMPTIELLAPVDETSPINKILEKNGVTPYHICYTVPNIVVAVLDLKKLKYVVVSNPVKAPAINNSKVAFLFNKNIGLIELVESPATVVL